CPTSSSRTAQDQVRVGNPEHVMPHARLDLRKLRARQPEIFLAPPNELPAILAEHPASELGLLGHETAVVSNEPSAGTQGQPSQFKKFCRALIVEVMQHARGKHDIKRAPLLF